MLRVLELLLKRKMQLAIWLMHNTKYRYLEWMCTSFILLHERILNESFLHILVHFPTVQNFPFPSDAHEQHSRMLIIYNRIFTFFLCQYSQISILCTHFNFLWYDVLEKQHSRGLHLQRGSFVNFSCSAKPLGQLEANSLQASFGEQGFIEWRATPFSRGDNS